MKVNPLSDELGKLVDEFLDDDEYYNKFLKISRTKGEKSVDPNVVKISMFSVVDGELTFAAKELEELFFEWQLFQQLSDHYPYSELLEKYPERKPAVMRIAHDMLEGNDVTDEDVLELFKGLTEGD